MRPAIAWSHSENACFNPSTSSAFVFLAFWRPGRRQSLAGHAVTVGVLGVGNVANHLRETHDFRRGPEGVVFLGHLFGGADQVVLYRRIDGLLSGYERIGGLLGRGLR